MAMVDVDSGSRYRRIHSLSRLAWSWVGGHLAPFYIHQMKRVNSCNATMTCSPRTDQDGVNEDGNLPYGTTLQR